MSIAIHTAIESEFNFVTTKGDKQEVTPRRYKIELLKAYPELSIKISVGVKTKLKQESAITGYKAATIPVFLFQDLLEVSFDTNLQMSFKTHPTISEPISGMLVNEFAEFSTNLTNNGMIAVSWLSWLDKLQSPIANINGWNQWLLIAMKLIDAVTPDNESTLKLVKDNTYLPLTQETVLNTIVETSKLLEGKKINQPLSLLKVADCANKLLSPATEVKK